MRSYIKATGTVDFFELLKYKLMFVAPDSSSGKALDLRGRGPNSKLMLGT